MGRPCINGQGKKRKSYQRTSVEYSHKQDVLSFIEDGHTLDETTADFYDELKDNGVRAKKKQINKWIKQTATIRAACESSRGHHQNLRRLGNATVLTEGAEASIVLWLNSLRKDGAHVDSDDDIEADDDFDSDGE
ncbi:hypothetical protein PI124_g16869 [Phytophthora idaei]|nr:hypothetical protein PI125_g16966 [Phytophthora idaei]KAG3110931.1 hypothetical protein PI126_g24835 [Phytophthora idaei]KAG3238164.1 hypothetical protein PI124_g16869 [Phytophthora idaei]